MPETRPCRDCLFRGVRVIAGRDDEYCQLVGYATCYARQAGDHCGPEARRFKAGGGDDASR